jgi:hypothetical protein
VVSRPAALQRRLSWPALLALGVAGSACSIDDRQVSVPSGGSAGSLGASGSGGSGGSSSGSGGSDAGAGILVLMAAEGQSADFGEVELGSSKALQFTLSNPEATASGPLEISTNSPLFSVDAGTCAAADLANGSSCSVSVTFAPTAAAAASARLSAESPGAGSAELTLSGQGREPVCTSSADCCGGCPGSQVCVDSACQCPGGTTQCGDECVNLATSANHCAACDHSCGPGGSCLNRQCQPTTIATDQEGALRILLDGSRVYWNLASTTGAILRSVDKAGGAVTDIVCTAAQEGNAPCVPGRGQAAGMALFDGKLTFSVDTLLYTVNLDGSELVALQDYGFSGFVDDITTGDGTYAWTTRDGTSINLFSEGEGYVGYGTTQEGDTVSVLPFGGCVYIASSPGTGVRAACGVGASVTNIYGSNNVIRQMVSDGSSVFAAEERVGIVRLTPAVGGPPALDWSPLASVGGAVGALALDATFLYYYEGNGSFGSALTPFCPTQGRIRRVPKAGGTATTLLDSMTICPAAMAVDATSLYWTDANSGQILKLPKQ